MKISAASVVSARSERVRNFGDIAFTPAVKAAQEQAGSRASYAKRDDVERRLVLTAEETEFIAQRDSFYLATVGENGWPYMQHRGGPPGFLRVLDERTLGFADYRGNRQYISVGNVQTTPHACLFLMEYPTRFRLKIWAEVEVTTDPAILHRVTDPDYPAKVEQAFLFRVLAFDWNCDQHITPRYTAEEWRAAQATP